MPRPSSLEPAALVRAMSSTPAAPSELAKRLGVSRATVHRKLEALVAQALVVRVGAGPQAAYRVPSAHEQVEKWRSRNTKHPQVRLTLPAAAVDAVVDFLDLYVRLGIGQIREIANRVRMERILKADGGEYSLEEMAEIERWGARLASRMLAIDTNASHSIHGRHVHPKIVLAYGMLKAIEHRVAWDRVPLGSMGYSHEEPLRGDIVTGFVVHSDRPDAQADGHRYIIEMPTDCGQVMAQALGLSLRVSCGDIQAIVDLASAQELRTLDGAVATAVQLEEGAAIAARMGALVSGASTAVHDHRLSDVQTYVLQVKRALERFLESGDAPLLAGDEARGEVAITAVGDSPWATDIAEMPDGYLLNFRDGEYHVLAASGPKQLTIVASSASIQTAVQMAKNVAAGQGACAQR